MMGNIITDHPPLSDARIKTLAVQFSNEPAYRHMGMELLDIGYGRCVASTPIRSCLLHHRSAMQGGIVAMIADATAGYAALSVIEDTDAGALDDMATLEFKTSFFRPVTGDALRCEATVISATRSIVFCRAHMFSEAGTTTSYCAEATLTFKRLKGKPKKTSALRHAQQECTIG